MVDFSIHDPYCLRMLNPFNSFRILLVKALKKVLGGVKFRGKGTLLSMICPRDREIMIDVAGYRFRCNLAEHIQRTIFLWGHDQDAFGVHLTSGFDGRSFHVVWRQSPVRAIVARCDETRNPQTGSCDRHA